MYSADNSHYIKDFINITKKLDIIRNQNVIDIIPQYKDLFNGHS